MVKFLLIGIWTCGLLSVSVFYFVSNQSAENQPVEKVGKYFGGLDYVKLDPVSVTIIRDKEIRGYLIIEAVFTIKQSTKDKLSVPVEFLLQDIIIGTMHGNADIDIFRLERFDVESFRKNLLDKINAKVGDNTIYDILIQKIDFISKDDVRDLNLRRS